MDTWKGILVDRSRARIGLNCLLIMWVSWASHLRFGCIRSPRNLTWSSGTVGCRACPPRVGAVSDCVLMANRLVFWVFSLLVCVWRMWRAWLEMELIVGRVVDRLEISSAYPKEDSRGWCRE